MLLQLIINFRPRAIPEKVSEIFVTGIFIQYNDESRVLHICDMGHAYIHLFRKGKCMRIRGKQ